MASSNDRDLRQLLKRRKIDSDMNFQMVKLRRESGVSKDDLQVCKSLIENISDLFKGPGQAEGYFDKAAEMDKAAMILPNRPHR